MEHGIVANNFFDYGYDIICNKPYQFLKDYNNMYLESNYTNINCDLINKDIFPTTLKADIAAHLFKGKQNLSETTLKNFPQASWWSPQSRNGILLIHRLFETA